ncbi:hypothetical protein CHS0354_001373 [Potamilus streckersoni]|uniref:Uncharacterized protein n=1 Tax=Potamilus streckersoni TaxID=2493646 RepID=A0AAE0TFH7_9BIVA|nr:hypothetical protein CHS0354_001373 [Potamilus streckersoni]
MGNRDAHSLVGLSFIEGLAEFLHTGHLIFFSFVCVVASAVMCDCKHFSQKEWAHGSCLGMLNCSKQTGQQGISSVSVLAAAICTSKRLYDSTGKLSKFTTLSNDLDNELTHFFTL